MKFTGIIPARYASTRFPGKPLADMAGKPMIQRVYERVLPYVDKLYVATDDRRIYETVKAFGGDAVMTSEHHKSGTERCYEAFKNKKDDNDVIINIQGDEPFIEPEQIELIKGCFSNDNVSIATLVTPFKKEASWEDLTNPNSPKVIINHLQEAIYFSRSVIPYIRNKDQSEWLQTHTFYKHIGIYAFKAKSLGEIIQLPMSSLEIAESLEQLRWIENGYHIKVGITSQETIGIDTPEDLKKAILKYQQ